MPLGFLASTALSNLSTSLFNFGVFMTEILIAIALLCGEPTKALIGAGMNVTDSAAKHRCQKTILKCVHGKNKSLAEEKWVRPAGEYKLTLTQKMKLPFELEKDALTDCYLAYEVTK